jgi:hypothetical protein
MRHKMINKIIMGARLSARESEQFSGHAQDRATLIYTLCN